MLFAKHEQGSVVTVDGGTETVVVVGERNGMNPYHRQCYHLLGGLDLGEDERQLLGITGNLVGENGLVILYRHLVEPYISLCIGRDAADVIITGKAVTLGEEPLHGVVTENVNHSSNPVFLFPPILSIPPSC